MRPCLVDRHLQKLFKLLPYGQNWLRPGGHSLHTYRERLKCLVLNDKGLSLDILHETWSGGPL